MLGLLNDQSKLGGIRQRESERERARNTGMKSGESTSSPKGLRNDEMKQRVDHRSWVKRLRVYIKMQQNGGELEVV